MLLVFHQWHTSSTLVALPFDRLHVLIIEYESGPAEDYPAEEERKSMIDVVEPIEGEETTMAKTYRVGFDFGNSTMVVWIELGSQTWTVTVPTAFARVSAKQLQNLDIAVEHSVMIRLEGETVDWAIGELAIRQSKDYWHGQGDIARYASDHAVRGLLALVAMLIPDKECNLVIASGLPAETYRKNRELRKAIKKAFTGPRVFTIDGGKTMRRFNLEYATCLMEGAGALGLYMDSNATLPAACIDIGGRTSDLYVADANGTPQSEFCKGKELGVVTAEKQFADSFEEKHHFEPKPSEVKACLYAYINTSKAKKKPYPSIGHNGKRIEDEELELLAAEAVTMTAREIVSFVASAWRESEANLEIGIRFSPIILIGGGAFYFLEALRTRITHLQRPEDAWGPVGANAAGYARAASAWLKKKLAEEAAAKKAQAASKELVTIRDEFELGKELAAAAAEAAETVETNTDVANESA